MQRNSASDARLGRWTKRTAADALQEGENNGKEKTPDGGINQDIAAPSYQLFLHEKPLQNNQSNSG